MRKQLLLLVAMVGFNGAFAQTLQTVTDNGNTTTNAINTGSLTVSGNLKFGNGTEAVSVRSGWLTYNHLALTYKPKGSSFDNQNSGARSVALFNSGLGRGDGTSLSGRVFEYDGLHMNLLPEGYGNVGIGTTTPATKLEVKSGVDMILTSSTFVTPYNLGMTSDIGQGYTPHYILLSPMIVSGVANPQAGLSGTLSLYRGTTSAGNINAEYRVIIQAAYSNNYVSVVPLTDNTVSVNVYKVTYNNQAYLAIKTAEITGSGGRVTFRGDWWNAIDGTKPQLVYETQLSDVSIYKSYQSVHGTSMVATKDGNIGIGTNDPKGYKLAVVGKIRATEIKVEATPWPDYVFMPNYNLPSLQETEQHIKEKGHLPGIPSAEEVKNNGVDLGEMNAKLLQKIEELTLHLIEQNKQLQTKTDEIIELREHYKKIESQLTELKKLK
ncbi:hypothetical protein [Solitalea canadensis]|uniref:BZIP transcription factor n=1 Tax=Solitalea canadensis (strain ATCC 29591 / DSM 3403 / JCM 21819 / LMG 8368 / NBRC 15130 / NCIMB 12057 / USAM 9D) TaxID=929556 RepID=H8KRJ1_SOLCM|nr:hypothetical protein [Solitalea canadensis]AFD07516.1 hypothetical protein Solca_2477 [Solitalea canadensis DSM 3403]